MIKHIESLPNFKVDKISIAKILSLYKAFGGTSIAPDFWVQEINGVFTAALSLYGSEMTVYCKNADIDEIRGFIKVISPKSVFTEKENALFEVFETKSVFLKNFPENKAFSENKVSLKELYAGLSLGFDGDIYLPSFEDFAPDISHRLRHNGAIAKTTEYGAALCFTFLGGSIISGIAIDEKFRHKGFGSKLLTEISSLAGGKVFACTDKKNEDFYIKNGFSRIGEAAITEMERV